MKNALLTVNGAKGKADLYHKRSLAVNLLKTEKATEKRVNIINKKIISLNLNYLSTFMGMKNCILFK